MPSAPITDAHLHLYDPGKPGIRHAMQEPWKTQIRVCGTPRRPTSGPG